MKKIMSFSSFILLMLMGAVMPADEIAIDDPGFEQPLENAPNKFGQAFRFWPGWIFSGPSEMRVGNIAHSGKTSGMIVCDKGGCARFFNEEKEILPGRYRLTFYIRSLDVVPGPGNECLSMNFYDNRWHQQFADFAGSCGWRKVTHVVDVPQKQKSRIYIGIRVGSGRIWVDDVNVEKVGVDVPLTEKPEFGPEETPIAMPGELDPAKAVRCPDCGYLNMSEWKNCYACGSKLPSGQLKLLPTKLLASFEDGKSAPFTGGEVLVLHGTNGRKSLKWETGYVSIDGNQDWSGYDFLKADFYLDFDKPVDLYVEIRDKETKDYWTRVNYNSLLLPGKNSLTLPTNLFVGEKSRPGRALLKDFITRIVFGIGDAKAPVYLDNLRLECDDSDNARFDGLNAFSFGPPKAPLLRGMTRIAPGTTYSKGRGYGFLNAQIWRACDVLQPDIVYRSFVCVEKGGFALDLPNGKYHVFINNDCPGGYWGELPVYRERRIIIEDQPVYEEQMDKDKAMAKYFRFADKEEFYTENTFDKYLGEIFKEKEFDVDVADGQLNIEFEGRDWTNCLSCIVVYPAEKMDAGKKYLANLKERRRLDFDNYFRRLLHDDKTEFELSDTQKMQGYVIFSRSYMEDVYPDSKPMKEELTKNLSAYACQGEIEPVTFALRSFKDLGKVKVVPGVLTGPGIIPASNIKVGYVSNRITRVNADGTIYTVKPRFVMNTAETDLPGDTSKWFWANIKVPKDAAPGIYRGTLDILFEDETKDEVNVQLEVVGPQLNELDVPAGPWGLEIRVPWFAEEMKEYNDGMDEKSLALMHEYGCTAFSSSLNLKLEGKSDELTIDFTNADRIMKLAKDKDMLLFVNYGTAIQGLNLYGYPNPANPADYGFKDLDSLYGHVFSLIDKHSQEAGWIPLVITICDEPIGDDVSKSMKNAALLKKCATDNMRFAGATSLSKEHAGNAGLVQSLDIANFNVHDKWSVDEANKGGGFAFYNGGNRWTYGPYMFMLRQKYKMKFRLAWHWNCNAGDPYYALDCREDDYAWANANAKGELVTSVAFERIREGIDDYRYLLTLKKLAEKYPGHQASIESKDLFDKVMALEPNKDRSGGDKWMEEVNRQKSADIRRKAADFIRKLTVGR
ncbi:MAG TPA: hypothetical protein DET40_21120 [Lentisphaeria bacterium]|nr:MAG: hypothetical protein A2X45_03030 [Lentisphaerae bacterium GWF2_50_93]HCE46053.1 hypothetical protein [Lentisphaeria bacterium]